MSFYGSVIAYEVLTDETAKKVSEGDLNSLKKEIEVGIYRYRKLYEELDGLEIIARGSNGSLSRYQ